MTLVLYIVSQVSAILDSTSNLLVTINNPPPLSIGFAGAGLFWGRAV